ncbi:hypothetical protein [Gracilibacillus alcaliphilus]|uniref:hypothetical protein n=1 Tax=Gracilibacillus alcaliphilus TaxID=1401441 RepID=UPI00195D1396|nr:hypothetical protein [Gracilibacillus alcaliphilus]MBM7679656.1 hypothetical protein [Gracilibacillus alcaliphilus]
MIIAVVVCVLACVLFKGKKQPTAASIILLVFAVISSFMTYGVASAGGILYICWRAGACARIETRQ